MPVRQRKEIQELLHAQPRRLILPKNVPGKDAFVSTLIDAAYLMLLLATSPWWLYAMLARGKYRRGWRAKLLGTVPESHHAGRLVWLHAVSVGEVNLLAPLVEELERRFPDLRLRITTTTDTGFEVACRRYGPDRVCYAPFDFSWAVRRVLRKWQPAAIVLSELELWPNWIRLAAARGVPVIVVNGRLSDRSFQGYRRLGSILRFMFARLATVAAQTPTYAERFVRLGTPADRVHAVGSLKFDGARTDRHHADTQALAEWARITPEQVIFLAGSTQSPEEALALEAFLQLRDRYPQLRLVLVPRHPQRFEEVASLLDRSGVAWARRSRDPRGDRPVVLVDTMGELAAWWGTAQIAYVGGSMGAREGQNMIEPAGYGAAVSFGPRTRNFRDVVSLLLEADAARVVHDQRELTAFVEQCLADPAWRRALGDRAQQVVRAQQGAVQRTVELMEPFLKAMPRMRHRVDGAGLSRDGGRRGKVCVKQ